MTPAEKTLIEAAVKEWELRVKMRQFGPDFAPGSPWQKAMTAWNNAHGLYLRAVRRVVRERRKG